MMRLPDATDSGEADEKTSADGAARSGSWWEWLRGHHFVRSVSVLAGGSAIGHLVHFLASPLLTRLYTPQEYGVFSVFTSLLFLITPIAALRYEAAIPLPDDDDTVAHLGVLSLISLFLFSGVLAIVVAIGGAMLARWVDAPGLAPVLWLLPITVFVGGIYQIAVTWAVRTHAFTLVARTELTRMLAKVGTQLGLGALGFGALGLVAGQVVGQVGGVVRVTRLAWRGMRARIRATRRADLARVAHRYREFPLISTGTVLILSAGVQLPALFMAGFYGPRVAGWLGLGLRVVGAPIALLGVAVGQVYLARAARLVNDRGAQRQLFFRTAGALFAIAIVPTIILALVAPWLFAWIFGESWSEVGVYVRALSVMLLLNFVATPLTHTLTIYERQGMLLAAGGVRLGAALVALTLPPRFGAEPRTTIAIYGAAMAAAFLITLLLCVKALRDARPPGTPGNASPGAILPQ